MKPHSRAILLIAQALLAVTLTAGPSHPEELRPAAPFAMPAIRLPYFPERDFRITDYGAVADGAADNTLAFRHAITACHDAGGGRVVVPPGTWFTGAIHLKSNVNLHLAEGAVLLFSDNPQDYLPAVQTSWEGMECFNYSPLIYAFNCDNVALTGKGTIQAKLDTWTRWFARPPAHMEALKRLYNMAAKGVPVEKRQMAVGENNLRPDFVQFNRCRNVLIEDLKIRSSPFWCLHLLLCDGVVVRRVDVSSHGHNNDGIDIAMSRNVLVEECTFDQGDDAIAVKSGSNHDGWRLNTPTENVVVRRCTVRQGHQLLAVGSDLSGGVRNVYVHDCIFAPGTDSVLSYLMFIKTNRGRGGFVENIWMENISARSTRDGILGIDTDVLYQWRDLVPIYEERITPIKGIHLKNIHVGETVTPFRIVGDARRPVRDIYLEDITIGRATGILRHYENVEQIHESGLKLPSLFSTP